MGNLVPLQLRRAVVKGVLSRAVTSPVSYFA